MSDLITETKKFNSENHKKNDTEAKNRFKKWFTDKYNISKKYEFIEEGEDDKYLYDAKIKDRKTNREVLVEFEMRSKKDFEAILEKKYPNIHIPYRKIKNNNKSGTYIVMGEHRKDKIIVIKFCDIRKAFKEGRYENRKCVVDNEQREDTFINISHEEATLLSVCEKEKYVGPFKSNINFIEGDIFSIKTQYIAHQCNCLTSHSAGFAKEVFENFPEADIYKDRSPNTNWKNLPKEQHPDRIVVKGKMINMMSQVFPGKPKYDFGIDSREKRKEYFKNCLDQISRIKDIRSVAFPHGIACNMGGGKWKEYLEMLEDFAEENPNIKVFVVKKR